MDILKEIEKIAKEKELPLEEILRWLADDQLIVVDGRLFDSFHAACKAFRVDSSYLYQRAKTTGVSELQLLKAKVEANQIKKQKVLYKGHSYASFSALCRAFEVDAQIVQSMASNNQIDRFEAFERQLERKHVTPRKRKGLVEVVEQIEYDSRRLVYRAYAVNSKDTLQYMRTNACTFETAILALTKKKNEGEEIVNGS